MRKLKKEIVKEGKENRHNLMKEITWGGKKEINKQTKQKKEINMSNRN
jgi:hypothetical protein